MRDEDLALLRRFYDRPFTEWPAFVDEHVHPEIEFVTREGRLSGREAFRTWVQGFVEATERSFVAEFELKEVLEADDGAIVALLEVRRRSRDSEEEYLTAWPANVWRFRDGQAVFFEGYGDRGKALRDHGVER